MDFLELAKAPLLWSRRTRILLMLGALFLMTGTGYLSLGYPVEVAEAYPPLEAHVAALGLEVWAYVFVLVGGLAILAALTRRHTLGFVSLMALSSLWALLYFVSYAMNGYWRAVTQGSVSWLLVVGFLWTLADWPDPVRTPDGMPDGAPVIDHQGHAVAVLQLPDPKDGSDG